MKLYDLTLPLSGRTPVYPGDPPVLLEPRLSLAAGDAANLSLLSLSTHAGTHVDPPLHFLAGGIPVDRLPLDVLVGPARVVETPAGVTAPAAEHVCAWDLAGVTRLLLKSSNSNLWRAGDPTRGFVHLTPAAAEALIEAGVR